MQKSNGAPASMKAILIPIILESLLRSLMGTVNVLLMSFVSDAAVGAIGVSNQYIMLVLILVNSVTLGSVVCVTQALGMGNRARAGALTSVAVFLNICLGLVFSVFFVAASPLLLTIMALDPQSIADATAYIRIVGGAIFITSLSAAFCSILRVYGRTKLPLVINIITNVFNIIGTSFVVFFPQWAPVGGVAGVGLANVISQLCGMSAALFFFIREKTGCSLRHMRPLPMGDIRLALSIGIPGSIDGIAYSMSQVITTSFISTLGTLVVTAKVYVQNIVQYSYLIGSCFGQAGQVVLSYKLGQRDFDGMMAMRKRLTLIAVGANIAMSLVCILLRRQLLGLFTADTQIIELAASVMLIDIFAEIGRGANHTVSGALRCVGDVKFSLIVNTASAYIVSVGVSYLLGIWAGLGLMGMWIAFSLDECTRACILLARWRSGKWMPGAKKRLDIVAGTAPGQQAGAAQD